MKAISFWLILGSVFAAGGTGVRAELADETVNRVTVEYVTRLKDASDKLNSSREQIAVEKARLIEALRAAEDKAAEVEKQIAQLEAEQVKSQEKKRQLALDYEPLRKTLNYLTSLARDSAAAAREGLAPGEDQRFQSDLEKFRNQSEDTVAAASGALTLDAAEFLLKRVNCALAGESFEGKAVLASDNEVVAGTFLWVGPEAYFQPHGSSTAGITRPKEGAAYPIYYPLKKWNVSEAAALMSGQRGTLMADPSNGKALVLEETKGTIWQSVEKGGAVSFAILGVGVLALILIGSKIFDLLMFRVESAKNVRNALEHLQDGREKVLGGLRASTRELFDAGFQSISQTKVVLEEHLWAVLLRQRLHFERRLSLLAVIAVVSPLMGLLGTVSGMVRTFALITVFGTGNAGKLAAGISEVLISTELGLAVAIPTLVIHGILTNRIHKRLALQERYALEFVTAVQIQAAKTPVGEAVGVS